LEREQLLGIAHAERQRLGRMVQYAEPETWEQPSACEGWWNRDVMAHLGALDTAAAQLVKGDPAVEMDEYRVSIDGQEFDVEGFNKWSVDRRAALPTREVLELWGRAAGSFLAYCALLGEEEWRTTKIPWLSGDIAIRYLVQSRVVEWWIHGEDVRATNGLGPAWQHWPIYLTADMGIRMLPWALGRAGVNASGRSVRVELSGAGEGSWHWGLGAGEIPRPNKAPDVTIVGRAPQFALVAGRRLGADEAIESGNVVVGGDRALGLVLLRSIRAYV
jgi:uncharacterized protein (TIGR03083 family)